MNTVFISARHKFLYTFSGFVTPNISVPSQKKKNPAQTLAQKTGGGSSIYISHNKHVSAIHPSFKKFSSSFYISDIDGGCQSQYPTFLYIDGDTIHDGVKPYTFMIFFQIGRRKNSVSESMVT